MICPTCRKPAPRAENPYLPFCSERCKTIDLGKWVSGTYRVATENLAPEDEDALERLAGTDNEDDER